MQEIAHTGQVIATEGDKVRVVIEQTSACHACEASGLCMAAESRRKEVVARALEPLAQGDTVELTGSAHMQSTAVVLAYVLPFVLLISLVAVLGRFIESEAVVGTVAILSLVPYLVFLKLFSGKISRRMVFTARKIQKTT